MSNIVEPKVENSKVENSIKTVFLVHSRWTVSKLKTHMEKYGVVNFIRIVYNPDGTETNRNICVMPHSTFEALVKDGFDQKGKGLIVTPYVLNQGSFPGEGRSKTIFIPAPKILSTDDDFVSSVISKRLNDLAAWNLIDKDSWHINMPVKSREEGGVKGGIFISFKKEVPLETICLVRIILHDTYWPKKTPEDTEECVFKCYWARDRRPNTVKKIMKAPIIPITKQPTLKQ